jgi:hypothetical protein
MNKLTQSLLILCLVGIVYLIYCQNIYYPNKLNNCSNIAIGFEKGRHYLPNTDTLEVTHQDISGYMKNIVSCIVD